MTKSELWQIYVKKNPAFTTSGAHFTASGLYKFFSTTYDLAHDAGVVNGKALADTVKNRNPKIDAFFDGLVGKMYS